MTSSISLPTGSWVMDDKRASGRRLVNCFSEIAPQTGQLDLKSEVPPAYIRRMFGISAYCAVANAATFQLTAQNAPTSPIIGYNSFYPFGEGGGDYGSVTPSPVTLGGATFSEFAINPSTLTYEIAFSGLTPGELPASFSFSYEDDNGNTWGFNWNGVQVTINGPTQPTTLEWGRSGADGNGNWEIDIVWPSGVYPVFTNNHTYTFVVTSGGGAQTGTGTSPVRGMRTMGGITYVVIGQTLYSMINNGNMTAPSTSATLTPIASGISGGPYAFVRLCDNTQCLFILIPGTNIGYTYTVNNGLSQELNETFLFYGAKDVWFIDTYMVFLALNGVEFYNDDGQITSGTGPITFTTGGVFPREFGTDQFIGMCVDHRTVHMFGELTSEGYVDAGNATESPFAAAPDAFMQIGCNPHCGYTVALQDQSVFWVANDLTVRRLNGQTPVRVSNSGIEALLEDNKFKLYGAYALTPTIGGHPLWILTIPLAQKTVVYDCLTTEWFDLASLYNDIEYWRPLCWYNAHGLQLVGDTPFSQIGYLDEQTFTEWGLPMAAEVTTQSVYDKHNRIEHKRIEAVVTAGQGSIVPTPSPVSTNTLIQVTAGTASDVPVLEFEDAGFAGFALGSLPFSFAVGSVSPSTINGNTIYLIASYQEAGNFLIVMAAPGTPTNLFTQVTVQKTGGTLFTYPVGSATFYPAGSTTVEGVTVPATPGPAWVWPDTNSPYSNNEFQNGIVTNVTFATTTTPAPFPPGTPAGATITLFKSDDAGYTWVAREGKQLGALGSPRPARAVWWRLGQSRDRSYKFRISDPTQFFMVDIVAELSGGKW